MKQANDIAAKVARKLYNERLAHIVGACPQTVDDIEEVLLQELSLANLIKDEERLDWLSKCTAGEWMKLNDERLSHFEGYLRTAIDNAIQKEIHQDVNNSKNIALNLLLKAFQGRADGFAKLGTEKGNAISNEYLTVISDIQHSIDLS